MCVRAHAKSLQSCPTLCDPMDCSLPSSFVHRDSPGKNTEVGCHALLQGNLPSCTAFLESPVNALLFHKRSPLRLVGLQTSQCYMSTGSCSSYSSLIIGFSPASNISTLCMHSFVFSAKLRSMEQFVCQAASSLVLFHPHSNHRSLPKFSSLSHLCKTAGTICCITFESRKLYKFF